MPRLPIAAAAAAAAAIAAAIAGVVALGWPSGAIDDRPYARWRNGVIVHVRNCEAPRDEQARLRCAGLYCAQRVSQLLTNAQQARLAIDHSRRDPASGAIEVRGSIAQYLHVPTLPTGFSCTVVGRERIEPSLHFGRRDAMVHARH